MKGIPHDHLVKYRTRISINVTRHLYKYDGNLRMFRMFFVILSPNNTNLNKHDNNLVTNNKKTRIQN